MTTPASHDDTPPFVIVGRIRKAHGLRGELVVEPITDEPDVIFTPGRRLFAGTHTGDIARDRAELHVERVSPFKEGLIVQFRGLADRTAAEQWRGRYLLLPQEETPVLGEDEIYVHELPGMSVRLTSGDEFGVVQDVYELPQGLVLDVRRPHERHAVMLLYDQSVLAVDREARTLTVEIPEGLLD